MEIYRFPTVRGVGVFATTFSLHATPTPACFFSRKTDSCKDLSYFTARDPLKPKTGSAWTGFTLAWTPNASKDAGLGKLATVLDKINSKTLGAGLSKTYYWMMYGNGSDYLDRGTPTKSDDKDVSGWHFWNPIDLEDNK